MPDWYFMLGPQSRNKHYIPFSKHTCVLDSQLTTIVFFWLSSYIAIVLDEGMAVFKTLSL